MQQSSATSPVDTRRERRHRLHREQRKAQLMRAAIVGMAVGLVAVGFQLAVERAEEISHRLAVTQPLIVVIAITAFLGGLGAWVTGRFAPEAGGSGIPHTKAVLLHLRTLRPGRVVPVKLVGGLLALAAGFSVGREGPTVQIGSALGRIVGDVLNIPRRAYGPLIAAGAGAGLAAAFNAPLAGFLFVMEELQREMSPLTYGTALIASVCSVTVSRVLLGQSPSFDLPSPGPAPLGSLPWVAILGVLVGLASVLFNRALLGATGLRDRLKMPRWAFGGVIGVLAGLLLVFAPSLTGGGHHLAETLLRNEFQGHPIVLVCLLLFVGKLLFTTLSYGTGVPGGFFAPLLVMGAFIGYAFGFMPQWATPWVPFGPAGYATIGMAAMLAGSVRAPLTGVVLIVEMTGEYNLLYALLVGAFTAYATAEALRDEPIYEALLERDLHKGGEEIGGPDEEPDFIEILVEPDSDMDGRKLQDLGLPDGALVVAVARSRRHLVPAGSTQLRSGDMLTVAIDAHYPTAPIAVRDAARAP